MTHSYPAPLHAHIDKFFLRPDIVRRGRVGQGFPEAISLRGFFMFITTKVLTSDEKCDILKETEDFKQERKDPMSLFSIFSKKKKQQPAFDAERFAQRFGYPYRIYPDKTAADKAYREAAEEGKRKGFTPILIPADPQFENLYLSVSGENGSVEDILASGADAEKGRLFLDKRFEDYTSPVNDGTEELDMISGTYDGEPERITGFLSLTGSSGNPVPVILFEIPTANPWEIAAYLPFGGWNECPEPADMLCVLRYWYEKYGAVPAAIGDGTLEMVLPSPVSAADADALAREHYAFTPDRVDQCTNSSTLAEVAASLRVSTVWYFWWD